MIYLLAIILFSMIIVMFFLNDRDFLSPAVISCSTFFICVFLAASYSVMWNLPMHFNTSIVIISQMLIFCLGVCLPAWTVFQNDERKIVQQSNDMNFLINDECSISFVWVFIFIFIMGVLFYFSYQEVKTLASQFSDSTNLFSSVKVLNDHLQNGDIQFSKWNTIRFCFAGSVAYVYLFFSLHEFIYKFNWKAVLLLIPVVGYIPFIIISGGRQPFIYLAIYSFITLSILIMRKNGRDKKKAIKSILWITSFLGILFFIAFFGIGLLNGKISSEANLYKVLVHYAGININALDVYINKMVIPEPLYPGTLTLANVYKHLHFFGIDIPMSYNTYITSFVYFGDISTNVYTAFRRYIQDYGYIGCTIIMFFMGFFYGTFYNFVKYQRIGNLGLIYYGVFCYPFFLFCREERFMIELLTVSTLYKLFFLFIIYYLATKKWGRFIHENL